MDRRSLCPPTSGGGPGPPGQDGSQKYSQLVGLPDTRREEGTLPQTLSSDDVLTSCWQELNPWPHLAAREADSPSQLHTSQGPGPVTKEEGKDGHWR